MIQSVNEINRIVHDLIYKIIASLEWDEVAKKLAISHFLLVQFGLSSHAVDNSVKLTMSINKTITNTMCFMGTNESTENKWKKKLKQK